MKLPRKIGKYVSLLGLLGVVVLAILMILGPVIGNTFSTINSSLCGIGDCPPDTDPITSHTQTTNVNTPIGPYQTLESFATHTALTQQSGVGPLQLQLQEIDRSLAQSVRSSIAYNAPASMMLEETVTIELLMNPSESPTQVAGQVAEGGTVIASTVEITPRMKAEILSQDRDAFVIRPIHAQSEQLIAGTETTRWAWLVTAQKGGLQKLTLVIYRLVKYEGQDHWREVETYSADIDVKVTFGQRIGSLDWQWIVGVLVMALPIPAFWRWIDQRKKKTVQAPKPKQQRKKTA